MKLLRDLLLRKTAAATLAGNYNSYLRVYQLEQTGFTHFDTLNVNLLLTQYSYFHDVQLSVNNFK